MTDEQRRKHNEYMKLYNLKNREKVRENKKKSYLKNREKILAKVKEYYRDNRDKILEDRKNSQYHIEYRKQYYKTIDGYARMLYHAYRKADEKHGRIGNELPEDYITVEYIKQTIQQPCIYSGETDWSKMGLDRIDNNLPHLKNNCVPCSTKCNRERGSKDYYEFLNEIGNGYRERYN